MGFKATGEPFPPHEQARKRPWDAYGKALKEK
jgi:hypothetical protein